MEAAAAAAGPSSDLLPGGAEDAVFRLCCALYLGSGSGSWSAPHAAAGEAQVPALGSMVAPLAASPCCTLAAEEIADSDDEEAVATAVAESLAPAISALLEGLAAAVTAVLAAAEAREQAGALGVCQKACAQFVRLLAAQQRGPREGGNVEQPLAALLCSLARRCRERLSVAVAGAAAPPLVCGDQGHRQRSRRQLASLAMVRPWSCCRYRWAAQMKRGRSRRG